MFRYNAGTGLNRVVSMKLGPHVYVGQDLKRECPDVIWNLITDNLNVD